MLFVSQSGAGRLDAIWYAQPARQVLTVGKSDDFVSRGGMIRLVIERTGIRTRINSKAVTAAGLGINLKLPVFALPEW